MGMYDYLNGEQIKFFVEPCCGMPDFISEQFFPKTLHYIGGNLRSYDKGSEVPWRTLWYNYGKDFNIIDLYPYEIAKEPVIHLIRNGINTGYIVYSKLTDNTIFSFSTYDCGGELLKIKNIDEFEEYYKARNAFMDAVKNIDRNAWKEELDLFRSLSEADKKSGAFDAKLKELHKKTEEESKKNDFYLDSFRKKVNEFYIDECEKSYLYKSFGALLSALFDRSVSLMAKKGNFNFVVSDERLAFIVVYNELLEISKEEEFINEYVKHLKLGEDEVADVNDMLKTLSQTYDYLKNVVLEKEMFFEKYALKDILRGRYKDYYKKYNILPYKGFDYSIWDEKEEPSE